MQEDVKMLSLAESQQQVKKWDRYGWFWQKWIAMWYTTLRTNSRKAYSSCRISWLQRGGDCAITIPKQCLFISTDKCVHFTVYLSMAAATGDLSRRKPATTGNLQPVSLYSSTYLTGKKSALYCWWMQASNMIKLPFQLSCSGTQ